MSKWIGGLALAVVAASVFPPAQPASASHVCVGIEKGGTIGPPLVVGTRCNTTPAHLCDSSDIGLHPTLMLYVSFCVPR